MEKVLLPFLFLLIAVGLFFSYIRPTYDALQAMDEQSVRLDSAIEQSQALTAKVQSLRQAYASISEVDHRRLAVLLPEQVDVVRTVIQFDAMAQRSGLLLTDFTVPDTKGNTTQAGATGGASSAKEVERTEFSFECVGRYQGLKTLLPQIERNLALMDVVGLSIADDSEKTPTGRVQSTPRFTDILTFTIVMQVPSLQSNPLL